MVSNREEIADHIENAFTGATVEKAELVAEAHTSGAPQRVLDTLDGLPDIPFRKLTDLWPLLPHLPIEAAHRAASPTRGQVEPLRSDA